MKAQTVPEPPVTLPDPSRPPRLVPGCDVCSALDRQRVAAEGAADTARATTCEVEIRAHKAADHARR